MQLLYQPFLRFGRQQKGVAAVEFAIIVPFMMILLVGIMDMGLALLDYRTTRQATESLAKTAAYLSVKGLTANTGWGTNPGDAGDLTGKDVILDNGMKIILGSDYNPDNTPANTLVCAYRMVKNSNTRRLEVMWAWPWHCNEAADYSIDALGLRSNVERILNSGSSGYGESFMIATVRKQHNFILEFFGTIELQSKYFAHVPSY